MNMQLFLLFPFVFTSVDIEAHDREETFRIKLHPNELYKNRSFSL